MRDQPTVDDREERKDTAYAMKMLRRYDETVNPFGSLQSYFRGLRYRELRGHIGGRSAGE